MLSRSLCAAPSDCRWSQFSSRTHGVAGSMTDQSRIEVVRLADVMAKLDTDWHMGKRGAAEFLGLGVRTIEALLDRIPHFRVGGRVLFRKQRTALNHRRLLPPAIPAVRRYSDRE